MSIPRYLLPVSVLVLSCFLTQSFAASRVLGCLNMKPSFDVGCVVSVDVLDKIAKTRGATNWTSGSDSCEGTYDVKQVVQTEPIRNITCDCEIDNNTCHVTVIDFAYNYLKGSIPLEWASMQLKYISVFANRLSGNKFPHSLGISPDMPVAVTELPTLFPIFKRES
ncbi:hypothetical protein EZV62_027024 [Acer yangbiense]|uniref:Leucine-rich repeat-containing N-terminal plant-type domain-containing protein n=1 Tax=Acer yangbiense TaxID=1000413 RepID=A0A5C7GT48_9ROSI|nr:hypothetical protein EZV62_027024 [Acer yangbiense]